MVVEPDKLRAELARACADASLEPASFAIWVVDGVRPSSATPLAYLHPEGRVTDSTVLVFRQVGEERARQFRGKAHRLALWREMPTFPDAALGPMLRHELEHACRWERSGTAFYEADERLRARYGRDSYTALPTEREANAAAALYAHRVLTAAEIAELLACGEFDALFAAEPTPDVVETTLALLGERVPASGSPLSAFDGGPRIELVRPQ